MTKKEKFNRKLDEVLKYGITVIGTDEHLRKWLNEYNVRLDDYPINLVDTIENLELLKAELEKVELRKQIEFKTYL